MTYRTLLVWVGLVLVAVAARRRKTRPSAAASPGEPWTLWGGPWTP